MVLVPSLGVLLDSRFLFKKAGGYLMCQFQLLLCQAQSTKATHEWCQAEALLLLTYITRISPHWLNFLGNNQVQIQGFWAKSSLCCFLHCKEFKFAPFLTLPSILSGDSTTSSLSFLRGFMSVLPGWPSSFFYCPSVSLVLNLYSTQSHFRIEKQIILEGM